MHFSASLHSLTTWGGDGEARVKDLELLSDAFDGVESRWDAVRNASLVQRMFTFVASADTYYEEWLGSARDARTDHARRILVDNVQRRRDRVSRRNEGAHGPLGVAVPSQAPWLAYLPPTVTAKAIWPRCGLKPAAAAIRHQAALRPVMRRRGRTALAAGPATRTQPVQ